VFNAREYVGQAIESALCQPETAEVIVVDDGSVDGSFDECLTYAKRYRQVKVLHHPDHKNHGAAASRNLGIRQASTPFVAFLDADDYYLADRFRTARELLVSLPDADGVYEAIGTHFEDQKSRELWSRVPLPILTTVYEYIEPEQLFAKLLRGGCGYFSFDGVVVRKGVFDRVGYFNESLRMFEDTEMMYKLAALCHLYPGSIEQPVAIRRVHHNNRITHHLCDSRATYNSLVLLWNSLQDWGLHSLTRHQRFLLSRRHVERLRKIDYIEDATCAELIVARKAMLKIACSSPKLFATLWFWRIMIPSSQFFKNKVYKRSALDRR